MSSTVFKITAIINGIIGFIAGIICGFAYPTVTVEYEYAAIQMGDLVSTKHFNVGLMILIWAAFLTLTLIYLAIYAHLDNQEIMFEYIKEHIDNKNTDSDNSNSNNENMKTVSVTLPVVESNNNE